MGFKLMVECRQRLWICHVGRQITPDCWANNQARSHRM